MSVYSFITLESKIHQTGPNQLHVNHVIVHFNKIKKFVVSQLCRRRLFRFINIVSNSVPHCTNAL